MPCRTAAAQRRYQREWWTKRRDTWLKENGPCADCGSAENLELDHIDPTEKVSHKIWSWSQERRAVELMKCQVLCHGCHREKTRKDLGWKPPSPRLLRPPDAVMIMPSYKPGACRGCGNEFGPAPRWMVYCADCGAKRRRNAS